MSETSQDLPPARDTVRISTVASIPAVLEGLGYDPVAVLNEIGIEVSLFADPDTVIPLALRSRIVLHCLQTTGCRHFGLLIGQSTGLPALGHLGLLARESPDVETALQTLVHYAHLQVRGAVYLLDIDEVEACFGYALFEPDVDARRQIEDGAVAVAHNILRSLAGPKWRPLYISFTHKQPANTTPFRQFFKAPLKFGEARNGICFSTAWLRQPIPGSDPEFRRLLQKQVDLRESQSDGNLVEQLQRVLHSALLTQSASAEHVAALFSMHPRTLHRRLTAMGTSYHLVLDQVRFRVARQMLEHSSTEITQIAAMLQYSDPSAFTRAFRRWSGITPARWRQQRR